MSGSPFNEILMCGGRVGGVILEVGEPQHLQKTTRLQGEGFTRSFIFSRLEEHARLVKGAHRCGPHYAADTAPGTRQVPKWTRIELQVIHLLKALLEHGELTHGFIFICPDVYRDMRGQA